MADININLTDRQKDELKKNINRKAAGQKADVLKVQLENQREDYQKLLSSYNSSVDKYNTASDIISKNTAKLDVAEKQKAVDATIQTLQATQRQIEYNEELAKVPTLMQEVGAAGKNALHDGLVTFLTEGINKADSLKDAFLDMIQSILERMQKVLAESIASDFMTSLFGTPNYQTPSVSKNNSPSPLHRATGGYISGGIQGKDSVPVMAMPGEFVVKTNAVSKLMNKYGNGIMHMINSGIIPESIDTAKIKTGIQGFINRYNNGTLYNFHVNVPKYADGGYIGKTGSNALNGTMDKFAFNISNSSKTPIVNTHIQNTVDSKQLEGFITTTVVKNSKLYGNLFRRR